MSSGKAARPRTWRWLVVLHDLPPMPPYSEVVTGFFTKRAAEAERRMILLTHRRPRMVRIDVERAR